MASKATIKSVEPNIADLVNGWLKSYKVDYKLEQESLNTEIDQALNDYFSKNGGKGGNRPDAKLLLRADDGKYYPILIEYKGYKDKLVKLDTEGNVANRNTKNQPDYTNINSYAVNGAVHYSNAVLHYTSYTDVIAIGVTGYKDASGNLKHLIGVYYVAKSNFGVGQKVDEYTDLSFLKKEHFSAFIEKVKQLSLPQDEIEKLKERREQEITASLVKLNNDIFKSEKGLSENDRVYYVLPCLTSSFQNQGLNYYAPKAGATVLENVISIPSNSDVYRAYYQTRDFTVLSDAYAIRWKSGEVELSPNQYLFMVMCINKVTDLPIYSYKNKLGGWNVVKNKDIKLPEKDGKIDFAFMETFISAIKKLAIKEVVIYSDRKIAATKEVVSKTE